MPLPKPSTYDTALALERYFHRCKVILGRGVNRKAIDIRRGYNPIAVRVKVKGKENGVATTQ